MPRHEQPPSTFGFDPYGNQNRLVRFSPQGRLIRSHFLGEAEVYIQIDSDTERFYLDQVEQCWELKSESGLLARARRDGLPDDPHEVGELLLTELWCIRWPVAIHLTGCESPGDLGAERWARIKTRYDQHLEDKWPKERVDYVLAVRERMRRAVVDSAPGKLWVVQARGRTDAAWCVKKTLDCVARSSDDGVTTLIEFSSFDDFGTFRLSSTARSRLPAWIQHADGTIHSLEAAR